MPALEERDYFTDFEILKDPYAFFEAVRAHGPIYQPPGRDYLIVTGFEESLEVLRNNDAFSAIIGLQGAAAALPFHPQGSDITAEIETHRLEFEGGDLLVNLDDSDHTNLRALVNTLFTPSRLKANERFIADYSDELVRAAVADGGVELIQTIATPFVTMVIADLLGVPVEDRQYFMNAIQNAPPPGDLEGRNDMTNPDHPFVIMGSYFAGYVADRRANPRDDILSELANAVFPDGSAPDAMAIIRLGMFMFGAGQDTSAKLLGNSMKFIASDPELQQRLREDPSLIPALVEEVLRFEGSTKQTARLARKDTRIGDVEVPAGTKVLLGLAAANRDPARWTDPQSLQLDRPRIREHVAFGRGKHVCAGAPLARVEVRVILEKFLQYTTSIELDETAHPDGIAGLDYEPSFIIRGLSALNLKLTPSQDFPGAVRVDHASDEGAAKPAYSTAATKIAALLDDPGANAVFERHFPGIAGDAQFAMAKGMTLRAVQAFAPAQFSDEALDALDADLAALTAH